MQPKHTQKKALKMQCRTDIQVLRFQHELRKLNFQLIFSVNNAPLIAVSWTNNLVDLVYFSVPVICFTTQCKCFATKFTLGT